MVSEKLAKKGRNHSNSFVKETNSFMTEAAII